MVIKVCGMRDAQNIREVSQLGVDMIGMIFYPNRLATWRCRAVTLASFLITQRGYWSF